MCGSDPHLSIKGNHAKGFSIATSVFNALILVMGWASMPTLFGGIFSMIGGSLLACGCCCPLSAKNLKGQMTAAAILCLLGTCIKMPSVLFTSNRMVSIYGIDYDKVGACEQMDTCVTYTTDCGDSWNMKCTCYETKDDCEVVRKECQESVFAKNTCAAMLFNSKASCNLMNDPDNMCGSKPCHSSPEEAMYKWCNDDTEAFSDCDEWDKFGFASSSECTSDLDKARIDEKILHEAEVVFRKPYTGLMIAGLICDVGVFIFGLLAAAENDFRGGEGGVVLAVQAKKGPKQVV